MLIVKKFGGSSVADAVKIKNVANRIIEDYNKGHQIVVVLSAQGDTTDLLLEKAAEITEVPSKRELDMLLTTGEQQSVALMAMAIKAAGYPAISLNAFQTGISTTRVYGNARIKNIEVERLQNELERRSIILVTGFQGINRYEDYTTLGRGGSDTTAVALAAALNADLCEIYTDVDGVYTADPRVVPDARKIEEITYDEMLELASLGAKVLHNRSVELAKKYKVNLVVRSSLNNHSGTYVKEETKVERMLISGVASDANVCRLAVSNIKDEPGKAYAIFSLLARNNVNVDIILQSIGRADKKDISFTVEKKDKDEAIRLLQEHQTTIGFETIEAEDNIAKVSIVGAGMAANAGVASKMFEALYDAGVNINMISTSEIKISVLVSAEDEEKAVTAIHNAFFRKEK
ncbi:aspartate kinase [Lachnospiraceae bacterium oral taxon 500]|nr:aspartate kinase [Lachnospiraceae bacterium oral taxon 500]